MSDSELRAINRYRKSVGLPPIKPSQSDVLRDTLLKVNLRPDVIVKEFNPETGQLEEIKGKTMAARTKKDLEDLAKRQGKRDWDVRTGWEKRIQVELPLASAHVRFESWSDMERDIVARQHFIRYEIGEEHGYTSKKYKEWAKANESIIVGFARDGEPMPPEAFEDFEDSGVDDDTNVVWHQPDIAGPGKFIYQKGDLSTRNWDNYIDAGANAAEIKQRIDERNEWLDKNSKVYGPGSVVTYSERANGDHVRSDGTLLSTKAQRAAQDIPDWKKFEEGRLEEVDGHTIPGPNALPKDVDQYGHNVAKTGRAKKMKMTKTERSGTIEFIEVGELQHLGGHIVCPVVLREYPPDYDELLGRAYISTDSHVSMGTIEASDLGQRYVETVTLAPSLTFILPPGRGLEKKATVRLKFYFRNSKKQMTKTKEWYCDRDIPAPLPEVKEDKEIKPVLEVKPKWAPAKPTKIMPGDMTHTPLEKAENWAAETHHGKAHQNRWYRVAATMGADNGSDPYTFDEVKEIWKRFGKNARWTVAIDWFDTDDEDVAGMVEYHSPLKMQGHFTLAEWGKLHGSEAPICKVEGFDKLTIWDAGCQMPNFWLEDNFAQPVEQWRLMPDGGLELVRYFSNDEMFGRAGAPTADEVNAWRKDHGMSPMDFPKGVEEYPESCIFRVPGEKMTAQVPQPASTSISSVPAPLEIAINNGDWAEVARIAAVLAEQSK